MLLKETEIHFCSRVQWRVYWSASNSENRKAKCSYILVTSSNLYIRL